MTNTEMKTADLRLEFIPLDGASAIPMEYPEAEWVTLERLTEVAKTYALRGEFTAIHVQRRRVGIITDGPWQTVRTVTMTITVTEA
jgi:hypothetical protein